MQPALLTEQHESPGVMPVVPKFLGESSVGDPSDNFPYGQLDPGLDGVDLHGC